MIEEEYTYCYQITEEDILGDFPYSKILQTSYMDNPSSRHKRAYFEFKYSVTQLRKQYPEISLTTLQDCIVAEAKRIRKKYPDCFRDIYGWYDRRQYILEKAKKKEQLGIEQQLDKERNLQYHKYNLYWNNCYYRNFNQDKIWRQLRDAVTKGSKKRLTAIKLY